MGNARYAAAAGIRPKFLVFGLRIHAGIQTVENQPAGRPHLAVALESGMCARRADDHERRLCH
jgi:hypothetical protein